MTAIPGWRRSGGAFVGLSAAAAAYLLASAWKIASPLAGRAAGDRRGGLHLRGVAVLRLPLAVAMPVLAIGSSLLLWQFRA